MASRAWRCAQLNADDLRWIFSNHPGWPRTVALKSYDNPVIVRSRFPMHYQPMPCYELELFRMAHKLDDVVQGARGDLDYFLKLSAWSRSHWEFSMPTEPEVPWHGFYLTTRAGMGHRYFCAHAADLFLQAMLALGRQARLLNVRKPGDIRLWNYEPLHALTEAYSDEFEKWVVVDANNCGMFTLKDSPVPLHALELHNLVMAGQGGQIQAHQRAFKSFDQEPRLHLQPREQLDEYLRFYTRFIITTANDLVARARQAEKPILDYEDMDLYRRVAWHDEQTPVRETSQTTHDPDDLYPSVNLVHMDLSFEQQAEGKVEVYLTHCVPNLDHFEVQVDGGAWLRVGGGAHERAFHWQLHPGDNVVHVRGVNASGLRSRTSTLALAYVRRMADKETP